MSALRQYLRDLAFIPAGAEAGGSSKEDKISALGTAVEYGVEGMKHGVKIGIVASGLGIASQVVSNWKGLGAPYMEMQELQRSESTSSGFAQGFVSGLLGWNWGQTKEHFSVDRIVHRNRFDRGEMDAIEMKAYNRGLAFGHDYGAMTARKKIFLAEIKRYASVSAPKDWNGDHNKINRIDYVIKLAAAFRKHWLMTVSLSNR